MFVHFRMQKLIATYILVAILVASTLAAQSKTRYFRRQPQKRQVHYSSENQGTCGITINIGGGNNGCNCASAPQNSQCSAPPTGFPAGPLAVPPAGWDFEPSPAGFPASVAATWDLSPSAGAPPAGWDFEPSPAGFPAAVAEQWDLSPSAGPLAVPPAGWDFEPSPAGFPAAPPAGWDYEPSSAGAPADYDANGCGSQNPFCDDSPAPLFPPNDAPQNMTTEDRGNSGTLSSEEGSCSHHYGCITCGTRNSTGCALGDGNAARGQCFFMWTSESFLLQSCQYHPVCQDQCSL